MLRGLWAAPYFFGAPLSAEWNRVAVTAERDTPPITHATPPPTPPAKGLECGKNSSGMT
ncbi:hypothetical protein [Deinococcus arenicola]|uniref:Uncharacterized protein n=1 Tax=Deinococcus arenicola TaxID=2994950 RepID=A0ABU4DV75_9DEIO|nr:hypothetical protein [Deinococcus sp. ZS9-10]MDV6376337.1 hypothetical protein [Deinococcus sp. ZS9-10]